jgi:fatty acid desaturase
MAVLTGLYGLFMGTGPFAKSVPLKEINKGIPLFVGVMAAAWASYTYLWTWLAVILLIVSTLVLFAFFEEFLMYIDIRSKERWFRCSRLRASGLGVRETARAQRQGTTKNSGYRCTA